MGKLARNEEKESRERKEEEGKETRQNGEKKVCRNKRDRKKRWNMKISQEWKKGK